MRGTAASVFPPHFHRGLQNNRLIAQRADKLKRILKVDDDAANRRRLVTLVQHDIAADINLGTWGSPSRDHANPLRNRTWARNRSRIRGIWLSLRRVHVRGNPCAV